MQREWQGAEIQKGYHQILFIKTIFLDKKTWNKSKVIIYVTGFFNIPFWINRE